MGVAPGDAVTRLAICVLILERIARVAKTSPSEFIRQVRTEAAKVTWPTRKETGMTTVMVLIMAFMLGLFFFVVDSAFGQIVKLLLSLSSG